MEEIRTPVRKSIPEGATPGTVKIPPSPFLKKLGYGTGIAVYKLERSPVANQVRSPWALKKVIKSHILNTEYGKRLHEEATILRKLQHANIVGFRALIKTKTNEECLAMEECSACLGNLVEERKDMDLGPFLPDAIMKVAADICEALNYLHTQALLLHADVKSYNILIKDTFDLCKLCDFGVTLPLTSDGEVDWIKAGEDAEYIGTKLWSAPEVIKFPTTITSKADIYSYGLVIWEMLALMPPRYDTFEESFDNVSTINYNESVIEDINNSINDEIFFKRPNLPCYPFDDSYKYVLELYHCCTEELPSLRPSAFDLTICIPEMIKASTLK